MKIVFNSHKQAANLYGENLALKFGEDKLQSMQAMFSEYNGDSLDDENTLKSMYSDEFQMSESDENSEESDIEGEPIMRKKFKVNSGNTDQLTIQQLRRKLNSLTKSLAECKSKNDHLIHQLYAVVDERDQAVLNAKNELVQLKEVHAREIMALNEKRIQEVAAAKMEMEKCKQNLNTNLKTAIVEMCHAEDQLKAVRQQLESKFKSRF